MSGSRHPVDRGRGVIRNVKILGARSRNGGMYSPNAMATAKPLYEGARVNIDHPDRGAPDKVRAFGDWFGVLENVRLRKDGLYGDLAYLTSHPLAGQVCEAAERFPASFGLSHNAQVSEAVHEGQTVYAAINRVRSVDIVCKPATTRGIFEAEAPTMNDTDVDDDPTGVPPANDPLDATDDDPDTDDSDWNDFVDQMRAVYVSPDDPTSRLHAGIELLFQLIASDSTAPDDATDDDAAPDDDADGDQATDARIESTKDQGGEARAARIVLESVGLKTDPARIATLTGLSNPQARRAVLAEWLHSDSSNGQNSLPFTEGCAAGKPRSQGGSVLEAEANRLQRLKTSVWDDPKIATLRLLGH